MQVFSNLGYARLAANLSKSSNELTVKASRGIPLLKTGEYFLATLFAGNGEKTAKVEIVKVTEVNEDVWKIERGLEDTESFDHSINTAIELRLTKEGLEKSGKQVLKSANTIVESSEKQFISESEKESINNALSALQELVHSKISKENVNAPNGVAGLDELGKLLYSVLPEQLFKLVSPVSIECVNLDKSV